MANTNVELSPSTFVDLTEAAGLDSPHVEPAWLHGDETTPELNLSATDPVPDLVEVKPSVSRPSTSTSSPKWVFYMYAFGLAVLVAGALTRYWLSRATEVDPDEDVNLTMQYAIETLSQSENEEGDREKATSSVSTSTNQNAQVKSIKNR